MGIPGHDILPPRVAGDIEEAGAPKVVHREQTVEAPALPLFLVQERGEAVLVAEGGSGEARRQRLELHDPWRVERVILSDLLHDFLRDQTA